MYKNTGDVQPEEFNIYNIFRDAEYVVPIYQRNYAWETREIEQLIEDINDSAGKYYLGTLIVNGTGKNVYEVIDGQQRLTTLYILLTVLGAGNIQIQSLRFEAREKSNRTLAYLSDTHTEDIRTNDLWYSEEILEGYKIICGYFKGQQDGYKENFIKKLKNVRIIRIQVPEDIDLNHYFEIMNTRGEQLELHEIVKGKILSKIRDKKKREIASMIWDACAKMDRYIQMNFGKKAREAIFGLKWDSFKCISFDDICQKCNGIKGTEVHRSSLRALLENPIKPGLVPEETAEDENERFESIISFPNLVLQVSEAMASETGNNDAGLDDKHFIELIKPHYSSEKDAKKFIFNLLKSRYLFDRYIIKREYTKDYKEEGRWTLQRLKVYCGKSSSGKISKKAYYVGTYSNEDDAGNDRTEKLCMLQACLRITYTSPKTMHWISEILRSLSVNPLCDLTALLEKYCCGKIAAADYCNVSGFKTERIIFTYLDYCMWRDNQDKYKDFKFQFRTSVEHFFPQNPVNGIRWKSYALNSIGNLALITVAANSKFSNLDPQSKVKNYPDVIGQSPKLMKMCEMMQKNNGNWDEKLVLRHKNYVIRLLENEIKAKTGER